MKLKIKSSTKNVRLKPVVPDAKTLVRNSYKAALPPSFMLTSRGVRHLEDDYLKPMYPEKPRILDFGCGNMRHALYLRYVGYDVYTYDINSDMLEANVPHLSLSIDSNQWSEVLKEHEKHPFDVVICNFVLNTVPESERVDIISKIVSLKPKIILIEFRSKIVPNLTGPKKWVEYEDGWITSRNNFQAVIKAKDVISMLRRQSLVYGCGYTYTSRKFSSSGAVYATRT